MVQTNGKVIKIETESANGTPVDITKYVKSIQVYDQVIYYRPPLWKRLIWKISALARFIKTW